MHSRWCYEHSVAHAGRGFGMNMVLDKRTTEALTEEEEQKIAGMPAMFRDTFGLNACKAQGAGEDQSEVLQADLKAIIGMLLDHLNDNDFIFGGRACLADFAMAGALKAHFLEDPDPKAWLAPHIDALEQYVQRVQAGPVAGGAWKAWQELETGLKPLLAHAVTHYHAFAAASIKGAAQGEKYFTCDLPSGQITARTMKRLDKARLHVQNELKRVNAFENEQLKASGVLDYYAMPPQVTKSE